MKKMAVTFIFLLVSTAPSVSDEYLGTMSSNEFCGDCIGNPFAPINNPFNANSLTNEFGPYGNPFSPYSPYNEFSTMGPAIYGRADGLDY